MPVSHSPITFQLELTGGGSLAHIGAGEVLSLLSSPLLLLGQRKAAEGSQRPDSMASSSSMRNIKLLLILMRLLLLTLRLEQGGGLVEGVVAVESLLGYVLGGETHGDSKK